MINLLNMDAISKNMTPVTAQEYTIGKGNAYHPEGLFSESIFGSQSSPDRRKTFSYIDLNCKVLHPAMYVVFRQLNRKIIDIIKKDSSYNIGQDGELIPSDDGQINGLKTLIDNFDKINFSANDKEFRSDMIDMIRSYYKNGMLFISKVLVIPAGYRDIEIDPIQNEIRVDPVNEYYQKIIRLSIQLLSMQSDEIYDVLSANMNQLVLNLYTYLSQKLAKKEGLVRKNILGKRADFTARGVIVGAGDEIKVDEIGVPIRMLVKLYEPFVIYDLMNSGNVPSNQLLLALKEFNNTTMSVLSIRNLLTSVYNGDELTDEIRDIVTRSVQRVISDKVVMAKRDPAINSESVQAFKPVLVEGNTIKINMLKVGGFNADFDGDSVFSFVKFKYGENKSIFHGHISELEDLEV